MSKLTYSEPEDSTLFNKDDISPKGCRDLFVMMVLIMLILIFILLL